MGELLYPDDWRIKGACKEEDPELFFPHPKNHQQIEDAKAICRSCRVLENCLGWALDNKTEGIWGATTDEERRAIKQAKSRREAV